LRAEPQVLGGEFPDKLLIVSLELNDVDEGHNQLAVRLLTIFNWKN
jgi:hypothetical protein